MLALEVSHSSENQPPASVNPSQDSLGTSVKLLNVVQAGEAEIISPLKYCPYHFYMWDFTASSPGLATATSGAAEMSCRCCLGLHLAAAPRLSLQCNCRLSWLHQTNSSTNTDILEGFSVAAPKNRPITWSKGCTGCSHELRNSLSLSKGSRKTRHLKQQHRVQFVSHLNGSQPS